MLEVTRGFLHFPPSFFSLLFWVKDGWKTFPPPTPLIVATFVKLQKMDISEEIQGRKQCECLRRKANNGRDCEIPGTKETMGFTTVYNNAN